METAAIEGVCRAVIVTALPIEFSAVCEHLEDRKEDRHPQGTVYECGRFRPATGREWEAIVIEIGAGNTGAAAEVERAITYCHPNVVLFAGVAGGLKEVAIGDVEAGSKVYGYESGKESTGFKPRPSAHESNYRLTQAREECGRFRPATGREWEAIVIEIGAGNTGAAAEVERAITYCHPNVVLFAGVAGGLKDVAN